MLTLELKTILRYIYQHKASVSFTPELVDRCRTALQSWVDNPDEGSQEDGGND